MSHIIVTHNSAANCVVFAGTSNPVYFNACLTALIDEEDNTLINVRNNQKTLDASTPIWEFYRVPYTEFADAQGNPFPTPTDAIEYINQEANVSITDAVEFSATDVIQFTRDATETTVLWSTGAAFPVNAIVANLEVSGLIAVRQHSGGSILATGIYPANVQITGLAANASPQDVVNAMNSLFSVTPAGAGSSGGTIYVPVETGAPITVNTQEGVDPIGDNILAVGTSGQHNSRLWSTETIDEPGEFFTIRMAYHGQFGLGLYSVSDGDLVEITNDSGNGHSGYKWSQWFYDYGSYIGPWTLYGSSPSFSYGPGWLGSDQSKYFRYATNEQADLVSGVGVLFKVGITVEGYAAVWYWNSEIGDWVMTARSNYILPEGQYGFMAKLSSGAVQVVGGTGNEILRYAVDPVAPTLNYRYIESPDGSFHYPLFATAEEANYVSNLGLSHQHIYVDDPTNTVWHMPEEGSMDQASAPVDAAGIVYTEIPTEDDSLYGPSDLTLQDLTFGENEVVNAQIVPQDTPATVTGLPAGLTYYAGFLQGTTGYVSSSKDHIVTVTRSNGYGTNVQRFTLTIQDNASLADLASVTEYQGNFVQPNRMVLSEDALVQYDVLLSEGQQITYSYASGQNPPTIGILNSTGVAALASFDPDTDTLGAVAGASGNNFAETLHWALRYVSFGGDIGGSSEKHALVGWQDNTVQTGSTQNINATFRLSYEVDTVHGSNHHIVLYRDGVEILRSNDHYSGDQTITLVAFEDQQQSDVYIPSNLTITNIGAGSTTPPVGFADPLLTGEMNSLTVLGNNDGVADAAAELTDTLEVGMRYVFPRVWVEENVLPYCSSSGSQVFVGVPTAGVDWTDVGPEDFDAFFQLEGTTSNTSHLSKIKTAGTATSSVEIQSTTNAFYDYALEWDGVDLHVIACNIGDINTQPGINQGGVFSRTLTESAYSGSGALSIVIGVDDGGQANLTTSGLQKIRIPFGERDILVAEGSSGNGQFRLQPVASAYDEAPGGHSPGGFTYAAPTVNAGYTYRFIYHPSMEAGDYIEFRRADDNTVYTTGVTAFGSGDPDFTGTYKGVEFVVPLDAPPLKIYYYNSFSSTFDDGRELPISGSTYVVPVTGVTQEGPSANQTGSNLFDQGSWGWLSIDEPLGAGERLVLDGAFLSDLVGAMPDNSAVYIGLKDGAWTDAQAITGFEGQTYLYIARYSTSQVQFRIFSNGSYGSVTSTSVAAMIGFGAFLELSASGNNIRIGWTQATSFTDDEGSTAYGSWGVARKLQTGDQGYGITTIDVMVLGTGTLAGNLAGLDSADVDWTGLSEISTPTAPAPLTTDWNKALDFSGSAERCQQVSNSTSYNPIMMGGVSQAVSAPTAGNTATGSTAHPWACAVVFNADGHNSNQHIWNVGEGSGSNDDNIYLRLSSSRQLFFGWGRNGSLNELYIGTITSGRWYGVYVGHSGERLSGGNASSGNLADCFDVKLMSSADGFISISDQGSQADWGNVGYSTVGGNMTRAVTGNTTVGGRGSNRSFHGKIASMVITTLRRGQPMPNDDEIKMIIRDPKQWLLDYKVGNPYRIPYSNGEFTFGLNTSAAAYATQVWLMGDGTSDGYAQIRNQVYPSIQNIYPLNMISMVSNDIQSVTITGLS